MRAFGYSRQGFRYAWREEAAFRQEFCLAVAVIPAGLYLGRSGIERALLIWPMLQILIVELLNSAVEAVVPPCTGAIIWLTASDSRADLYDANVTWYPHTLGDANVASMANVMPADVPRAVWQSIPTEVAFGPTLLGSDPADAPIAGRQGLFMVLVQRTCRAVRSLSGRYLGVRIQLNGNGRITPEIAAMRIYGPRFSYVQNYLPQIYREHKFGPAADQTGPSTRRDFFERFVNLFEAQFTRIEDRIANAYLLTRAESTPARAGWTPGTR